MNFSGKVVLITGASSGIGADAAIHLAKLGANVSIVGRNKDRLSKVADQITKNGSPNPLAIVADVTTDSKRIVDETIERFGQLDVLVNNAGIGLIDDINNFNVSEFDCVFSTNVRSIVILTELCVPHLEKSKGNIINVSSAATSIINPSLMTYTMTKGAIDQFTKCLSLNLAAKRIRVNCINPSVIKTPLFDTMGIDEASLEAMYESFKDLYPVGRVGDVSDTSAAIAFLADDKSASFLTGVFIHYSYLFIFDSNLKIF